MKISLFFLAVILSVFIIGCAAPQQAIQQNPQAPAPQDKASVDSTPVQETQPAKTDTDATGGISSEVKGLLDKSASRITSLAYAYKGLEPDLYQFYVKGDKIKYLPPRALKSLDLQESYDTIFIDKSAKTAWQYCDSAQCKYGGKKEALEYADAYIFTPMDWASQITSAEKTGEELIESRSTWIVKTNKGTMWLDTFYGIPLKVESDGNTYKFQQVAFNKVQDSDVVPSS